MRKTLALAMILGIFLALTSKVFAHEMFWHDRNVDFEKLTKIVVFPFSNTWDESGVYYIDGYGTQYFNFNDYFNEMLSKKIKKSSLIYLAHERKFEELLQPFENEQARAAAVKELTNANAYIVPRFRERRVQTDISPRKEFDVELKSWTEVTGGPEGYEKFDERKRTVYYVVPETEVYLSIMEVEFTVYNSNGEVILTFISGNRSYKDTEEKQFKDLVNDFKNVFDKYKDSKPDKKVKPNDITVGFQPVVISSEDFSDDIHLLRAADYSLKAEANKKINNVCLITHSNVKPQYQIRSTINDWGIEERWIEPSYSVTDEVVDTYERKWKDKDRKERTEKFSYYEQEISDNYAHWAFSWKVNVKFELVDSNGNVVLSETYRKSDDKPADVYRHAVEDFCKQINSYFKNKKKNK